MTIVSNVHLGLPGWYNHSFSLNERCDDGAGANAYQCITPGTCTNPPTGNGSNINPASSTAHFKWLSAVDFTDPNSWFNAQGWFDNVELRFWNDAYAEVTIQPGQAYLNFYGASTNGYNILVRAAPGESLSDRTGTAAGYNGALGVAFRVTGGSPGADGNFAAFTAAVPNISLQGLQFKSDAGVGGVGNYAVLIAAYSGGATAVSGCLFDLTPTGTNLGDAQCQALYFGSGVNNVVNSVFIDRRSAGDDAGTYNVKYDTSATGVFVNNTVLLVNNPAGNVVGVHVLGGAGAVLGRNNAMFGFSGGNPMYCQNATGAVYADHNVTDAVAFSPGSWSATDNGNNLYSKSFSSQFVNNNGSDLRLKAGSDCINTGYSDTIDVPSGADFFGRPRSAPWDMGAAEYSAAQQGTATLGGTGHVTGTATSTHGSSGQASATFAGAGGALAPHGVQLELASDLPGYTPSLYPPAGSGHMADVNVSGSLVATTRQRATASSAIGGVGTMIPPIASGGHATPTGNATIGGTGGLSATARQRMVASLTTPAGAGSVYGNPVKGTTWTGAMTRNGAGSVVALNSAPTSLTNWVRNPEAAAAGAGTPGTDPTGWSAFDNGSGLSRQVVGSGTDSGIPYLDFRVFGTSNPGTNYYIIEFDDQKGGGTGIANGTTWATSAYLKQQAGSQSGIGQIQIGFYDYYLGGYVGAWYSGALTITSASLASQLLSTFSTITDPDVDELVPAVVISTNSSAAIDLTLRIGAPQFEHSGSASSTRIIPPSSYFPAQGVGIVWWF